MKKKALSLLLAGVMAFSMTACAGSSDSSSDQKEKQETKVVLKTGEEVSGDLTYNIDMTSYEKGKKVQVWLPVASSSDYQTIGDPTFDANGGDAKLTEDSNGNKMLYIEWGTDAEPSTRKASCTFHVDRFEYLRPELKEEGKVGDDMKEYFDDMIVAQRFASQNRNAIVASVITALDIKGEYVCDTKLEQSMIGLLQT